MIRYKVFVNGAVYASSSESVFEKAAAFATSCGERLVSISTPYISGNAWEIVVWYREETNQKETNP